MSLFKLFKLLKILQSSNYISALFKGVAASVEQADFLNTYTWKTIVDIGANRGQFSLAARQCQPDAKIFSFEPLLKPAETFRRVFSNDDKTILFPYAIGTEKKTSIIHLSSRDDSSSLLPITDTQKDLFPGTAECGVTEINVVPLDEILKLKDIKKSALLKLDVQGYELEALMGSESFLQQFDHIYVECSFIELYKGQALVHDIIDYLSENDFYMGGIYNLSYDKQGVAIQGDFLFIKNK